MNHSDLNEFLKIAGGLGINGIIENYSINMKQNLFLLETKEQIFEN